MDVTIKPSKPKGKVSAPPSKSMAHRLLICAGLAEGESIVRGVQKSEDVSATLDCLEALGAKYTYINNVVKITGIGTPDGHKESGTNTSVSARHSKEIPVLPCRECGSTLRFMIPIAMLYDRETIFTGSKKLLSRPLNVYEDICRERRLLFEMQEGRLSVHGVLPPGLYRIPGNISSQFISGLLFTLPLLKGNSRIELTTPLESRSYIDMTIAALKSFGVNVSRPDELTIIITGGQHYKSCDITVEGDYSNAAFLTALGLVDPDNIFQYDCSSNFVADNAVNANDIYDIDSLISSVSVTGLNPASLQGDRIYGKLFNHIRKEKGPVDISDCPDLGPVLFAVAALFHGGTFTGTRRLKIKESDRAAAMQQELSKFGINVDVFEDSVVVHDNNLKAPAQILDGHNDHRIVMALAVLLTVTGGTIRGAEAVNKSFPDFFEVLRTLGVELQAEPV